MVLLMFDGMTLVLLMFGLGADEMKPLPKENIPHRCHLSVSQENRGIVSSHFNVVRYVHFLPQMFPRRLPRSCRMRQVVWPGPSLGDGALGYGVGHERVGGALG